VKEALMAITTEDFMARMKEELGFHLQAATFPAFGQQIYAGYSNVFDLEGNHLRRATEADIKRWNDVSRKIISEHKEPS
jgi:hypothetical protein